MKSLPFVVYTRRKLFSRGMVRSWFHWSPEVAVAWEATLGDALRVAGELQRDPSCTADDIIVQYGNRRMNDKEHFWLPSEFAINVIGEIYDQ